MLKQHVYFLFGPSQGCLSVEGHTKTGLKILADPRGVMVGGKMITLGGAGKTPQRMIKRCLEKMQRWLIVWDEIIHAEFPSFDVALALGVLDLARDPGVLETTGAWSA